MKKLLLSLATITSALSYGACDIAKYNALTQCDLNPKSPGVAQAKHCGVSDGNGYIITPKKSTKDLVLITIDGKNCKNIYAADFRSEIDNAEFIYGSVVFTSRDSDNKVYMASVNKEKPGAIYIVRQSGGFSNFNSNDNVNIDVENGDLKIWKSGENKKTISSTGLKTERAQYTYTYAYAWDGADLYSDDTSGGTISIGDDGNTSTDPGTGNPGSTNPTTPPASCLTDAKKSEIKYDTKYEAESMRDRLIQLSQGVKLARYSHGFNIGYDQGKNQNIQSSINSVYSAEKSKALAQKTHYNDGYTKGQKSAGSEASSEGSSAANKLFIQQAEVNGSLNNIPSTKGYSGNASPSSNYKKSGQTYSVDDFANKELSEYKTAFNKALQGKQEYYKVVEDWFGNFKTIKVTKIDYSTNTISDLIKKDLRTSAPFSYWAANYNTKKYSKHASCTDATNYFKQQFQEHYSGAYKSAISYIEKNPDAFFQSVATGIAIDARLKKAEAEGKSAGDAQKYNEGYLTGYQAQYKSSYTSGYQAQYSKLKNSSQVKILSVDVIGFAPGASVDLKITYRNHGGQGTNSTLKVSNKYLSGNNQNVQVGALSKTSKTFKNVGTVSNTPATDQDLSVSVSLAGDSATDKVRVSFDGIFAGFIALDKSNGVYDDQLAYIKNELNSFDFMKWSSYVLNNDLDSNEYEELLQYYFATRKKNFKEEAIRSDYNVEFFKTKLDLLSRAKTGSLVQNLASILEEELQEEWDINETKSFVFYRNVYAKGYKNGKKTKAEVVKNAVSNTTDYGKDNLKLIVSQELYNSTKGQYWVDHSDYAMAKSLQKLLESIDSDLN